MVEWEEDELKLGGGERGTKGRRASGQRAQKFGSMKKNNARRRGGLFIILLSFILLIATGKFVGGMGREHTSNAPVAALGSLTALVMCIVGGMLWIDDFIPLEYKSLRNQGWYLEMMRYRPDFAVVRHRGQAIYSARK